MSQAIGRALLALILALIFEALTSQIEDARREAREDITEIKARLDSLQTTVNEPPWWR
jgi:hypothetical protein